MKPKYSYLIPGISALLITNGCATAGRTALLGAGIGAAAGTGIGLAVQKSPGSALIGAGIGALLVGSSSYLWHKDKEKKELMSHLSEKARDTKDTIPYLKAPEASCTQMEEKIEGDTYTGSYLRCTIQKPAVWSR